MKEYLKMADVFEFSETTNPDFHMFIKRGHIDTEEAEYAAHAINSHDELVAEVERLRESLKWAVGNLPFENAFEWSDDENADSHYTALRLLGIKVEE